MIDKLNIGAGNWALEGWATLDNPHLLHAHYPTPDIDLDLTTKKPILLEDNSVFLVFCSHLIEHLFPDQVQYLFEEVHRILKPGGIFRVICPNMNYYIREYEAGKLSPADFARSFYAGYDGSDDYARGAIDVTGPWRSIDFFSRLNPPSINKEKRGWHVSYYNGSRLTAILTYAGFPFVREAKQQDLASSVMQDLEHFDCSHIYMSLYVEAVK